MWKRSFISTVRSSIHTNLPRKQVPFKWKHCWLCVLIWTEKIFKMELCQNDWWLLRFQISPTKCGWKTLDVFSDWLIPFSSFSGVLWTGHECLQFQGSHSKLNGYIAQNILHERLQINLPNWSRLVPLARIKFKICIIFGAKTWVWRNDSQPTPNSLEFFWNISERTKAEK